MGAPMGNKNASGPHTGRSQHGKKSGFRNTLKKRYGAKLHQHNKKSGFKSGSYLEHMRSARGRAEMLARERDPRFRVR